MHELKTRGRVSLIAVGAAQPSQPRPARQAQRLKTFTFSGDAKGDLTVAPVQPMSAEDAYIWWTEVRTKIK